MKNNLVFILLISALVTMPTVSRGTVPSSSLPNLSDLIGFALFGNNEVESAVTIHGNVGVTTNGTFKLMAPSTVNGGVYLANSSGYSGYTFAGTVNGSIFYNQNLTAAQSQVSAASMTLAALTPDVTVSGNQTTALSYNVTLGNVEVVDLNGGLNLNNVNITLTGGGDLVLNIRNSFTLTGTASIVGNAPDIFVNYLGTSSINTHVGDVVDGVLLIPTASASLDGTFSSIFSGSGTITLLSQANVYATPVYATPEPAPFALMAMSLGFWGILRLRARRI
jgi:hypothetical protein